MGDFNTLAQEENIKKISNEDMDQEFEEFKNEIKTDKISIDDTAEAFDDHGTEILEGIMEDMMTNFAKIDGEGETDPKLETYELAYQAFEQDIETLIAKSKVVEKKEETSTENVKKEETYVDDIYAGSTTTKKTKEKTPKYVNKLNELLTVVEDIKYLVQLKKLEEGKDPGEDFDAGKLMVFAQKTEYFKENPPKKEGETRKSLITKKEETVIEEKNKIETEKKTALSAQEALNTNRTTETAKNFFETVGNKDSFNAVFDKMATIIGTTTNKNLCEYKAGVDASKTDEQQVANFVNLIGLYTGNEVTSVKLEKASGDDIYTKGTRIVVYKTSDNLEREITFGSQDQMQKDRAETFDVNNPSIKLGNNNPLEQFDGKGNFRAFEKYIIANPAEFDSNFKHVVDAIMTYTKPTDASNADNAENETALKNGYANVLTDYILSVHPTLTPRYISYLTAENLTIFGADKDTRIANFNKLAGSTAFVNTLTEEQKKTLIDLRTSIAEEKKTTLTDSLKNVSNLIVSLMMMFGLGKGTLKSRLPESMRKEIDAIYAKEFALTEAEKKAITELTKSLSPTTDTKRVSKNSEGKSTYTVPKATDIKASVSTRNIASIAETKEDYIQHIDPKIIKKGIASYNEDTANTTKLTESNFIVTKNGKEEPNISGIKSNKADFKKIMEQIWKSDVTRTTIAQANKSIRTTTTKKVGETTKEVSEYFTDAEDRENSVIKSPQDVGIYFTSYLFAGSKGLGYTITENSLISSKLPSSSETATEEPLASYTISKETKMYQDSDVTKTTDMKVGDKVTATKVTTTKTGAELKLTGFDAVNFKQVTSSDGKTIGWIENTAIDEVVEVTDTKKTLAIDIKYATVSAEGIYTLTAEVEPADIKIHNIFTGTLPETLKFTSKSTGKEVTIVKGKDPKDNTTDTYLDELGKRVVIREGDKLEAIPEVEPETVAKKREAINTALKADDKKTAKTTFEGTDYKLDETNIYQKEIKNLSDIFTSYDYKTLITEVEGTSTQTTLKNMVKNNMVDLKNMFGFWNLQKDVEPYKTTILGNMTNEQLKEINPETQTFELKEAKDNTIIINVSKNKYQTGEKAKEGTVTLTRDPDKGTLTVVRAYKTVETKETPATT